MPYSESLSSALYKSSGALDVWPAILPGVQTRRERLAEYVRSTKEQKGLSFREIARASGGLISHGTVSDIINCRSKDIKLDTLRGLAKGLGVPEEDVFQVAFGDKQTAAIKVAVEDALINALPFNFGELSEKDKREVRPILEMIAKEIEERKRRAERERKKQPQPSRTRP